MKGKPKFRNIDIDNNKFTGEAITELMKVMLLAKLSLIKKPLSDNQMTGICNTLKSNPNMTQIYMSHNQLS